MSSTTHSSPSATSSGAAAHKLQPSVAIRDYLRPRMLPSTWCPGCGLGIVLNAIVEGIHRAGLNKNDVTMVSGIGCTGRTSGYADFNTIHTTHGRAPAFATGVKLSQPRMTVLTIMGDGDAMSIGGGHLMHAMRRNMGMVAIVVNNNVYALTGGQTSPTTPIGGITNTAAAGSFERPMNLEVLARAAGAAFYARATVNHTSALTTSVEQALKVPGFALIEIVSNCHVIYGRMNNSADATKMIGEMDARTVRTTPVLQRRSQLTRRITSEAPDGLPLGQTLERVQRDVRLRRGIMFDRSGSADYSHRYFEAARRRRLASTDGVS